MQIYVSYYIIDPSQKSSTFYENSKLITAPIVNIIIDQSRVSPPEIKKAQINEKNHTCNLQRRHEKAEANLIAERLAVRMNWRKEEHTTKESEKYNTGHFLRWCSRQRVVWVPLQKWSTRELHP